MRIRTFWLIALAATTRCASYAPGAEKVIVTRNASDVAGCKALGMVKSDTRGGIFGDPSGNASIEIRNEVVGLGGDTLFVTGGTSGFRRQAGLAYNCQVRAKPAADLAVADLPEPIRGMRDSGLLLRLDLPRHDVFVDGSKWALLTAEQRADTARTLARFCASRTGGGETVSIFDEASRVKVGAILQ